MSYQDKTLVCKDCGNEFVFTAGEQKFYAEKGFQNEPARCKDCRTARKKQANNGQKAAARAMFSAICSNCGVETEVPFKPTGAKPVYCRTCYQEMKKR